MITAGIDCGAKTVKVVILKDDKVIGKAIIPAGIDTKKASEKAFEEALKEAGIKKEDIDKIVATGAGRADQPFTKDSVTEVSADAKGINFLYPNVHTVIDVGAEESRAIRVDGKGMVMDFAVNEKCAAGSGAFIEAMARALEVTVEEIGPLSLQYKQEIAMNAQCAVFAESELVTLVHQQTPKPDMARAIHAGISDRIVSMARRAGLEPDIAVIGGVAKNPGFIDCLNKDLNTKVIVPDDPEFVGALGAAIAAKEI